MAVLQDIQKSKELKQAEKELQELKKKIIGLRKEAKTEITKDYELKTLDGQTVNLFSLFGDKDDLIVVHNMGRGCPYCTLWADGFNGIYKHLENRVSFALVSHDSPEIARRFVSGRNWKFRVLANDGGPFSFEMGYADEKGNPYPGVSTFHRDGDGKVYRVAHTSFGPGDDFCSLWHLFDLLNDGPNGWQPRYVYG
jgi:predicted dithiol-disulfide oxidoreductase (DUF899 family)